VKSAEPNLDLTAHGEVRLLAGRRGVFRSFQARDGTRGSFIAGRFRSLGNAKRQAEQWLKIASTITSKEQKKDQRGHVVGIRIVGIAENPIRENFFSAERFGLLPCPGGVFAGCIAS
jgi:hypothetical protein